MAMPLNQTGIKIQRKPLNQLGLPAVWAISTQNVWDA